MISRLFYSQLPLWARPEYPLMRHALGARKFSLPTLLLRLLLMALVVGVVIALSYAFTVQNGDTETPGYREFMYYPLVGAQLLANVLALALTANVVSLERQKGTWDSLQITLVGAGNLLRTRWALVFYRLRWLLAAIVLGRVGYVALLMQDTTEFEGRAIDVRIVGINPELNSIDLPVFLLAALMTVGILLPLVAVGLNAALGILIATLTRQRNVGILFTVVLMMLQVTLTAGALVMGGQIVNSNGTTGDILNMDAPEAWGRLLFFALQGDFALRMLSLEIQGNIWADVENGLFIGGVLLVLMLLMALASNLMLLIAAWRASRPARV